MQQQQQISKEPAKKMYVFGAGWTFLRRQWAHMSKLARDGAQKCFNYASMLYQNGQDKEWIKILYYIALSFCILAGWVVHALVIGAMVLFAVLFALVLAISASFCLAVIGLLRLYSWLYRRIWRIDYDCPHPYCYARSSLPIFTCSYCHQEHKQLHPNTFGIWSHRCKCGTKLRTQERFGRKKLVRRCSACHNIINPAIGQNTNIHIPVIGGPSSGKTHYIIASTNALKNTYAAMHNYHFSFPDPNHQSDFERNVQRLLYRQTLAPTPEVAPSALILKMDVPNVPVAKMLYIYDAAGEAYNTNARASLQTYYKHICGLIFIIDPCAITLFRLQHEQQINAIASSLRPCHSEIMQVHDRMMLILERTRGLRRLGRYRLPISVVITKVDALGLEQVIGADAARVLMRKDPSYTTVDDAIHVLVQNFLRQYGLSDLLRNLESQFSTVRYFSCSVFGHSVDATGQSNFMPIRVLDPLSWLLSKAHIIKPVHP